MRGPASVCPYMMKSWKPSALERRANSSASLRIQLAAGLRDVAQRWQVLLRKRDLVEQLELRGNQRERGHFVRRASDQNSASTSDAVVSTSAACERSCVCNTDMPYE